MFQNSNIPFIPVQGTEIAILAKTPQKGHIYFATDTKKIYYPDVLNNSYIPMGGNQAIYYGNKELNQETGETDAEEIVFYSLDLETQDFITQIPAIGDLILNIPNGSFYRIKNILPEVNAYETKKLTISGSGGDNTTGGSGKGTVKIEQKTNAFSVIQGYPCILEFTIITKDADKQEIDTAGYIEIRTGSPVGGALVATLPVQSGYNSVDVTKYLYNSIGLNVINITCYMDVGGIGYGQDRKPWNITSSIVELNWNYDNSLGVEETYLATLNDDSEPFELKWTISGGDSVSKYTEITIDDGKPILIEESTDYSYSYTFENPVLEGLSHGAHKITLSSYVSINGNPFEPLTPITKRCIFYNSSEEEISNNYIISCNAFDFSNCYQYDTINIPIVIYGKSNIENKNASITLFENGKILTVKDNVENRVQYNFPYIPSTAGLKSLVFSAGNAKFSMEINVQPTDITMKEVSGYAFKFKASDFMNNDDVKKWSNNSITANFSDNFDWVNGGLQYQGTNGSDRQSFKIPAGSSMTINYEPFKIFNKEMGKCFKMVFKTSNCRNWDASVLYCHEPNWVLNPGEKILLEEEYGLGAGEELLYSSDLKFDNNFIIDFKQEPEIIEYDIENINFRTEILNKYIKYNDEFYKCSDIKEKVNSETGEITGYTISWNLMAIYDQGVGMYFNAHEGLISSLNNTLGVKYTENQYIELEVNIDGNKEKKKTYITMWIDGVPCGVRKFSDSDIFNQINPQSITIGSNDCDVDIYLIKLYEKGLDDLEHLHNFVADAPNYSEMVQRFKRNNIYSTELDDISLGALAKNNPDCLIHEYDIQRMTLNKNDKIGGCSYKQYQGSDMAQLFAENVEIKVQGTSSAAYGLAAFNLDSKFKNGFTNQKGDNLATWSMNKDSIGCDYFTTKVNVASCENANNALNQEWYNKFQPYPTLLRCKNPKARDCMEFTPGVVYIKDRNETTTDVTGVSNNLFVEIDGYVNNPNKESRFYSICNMGNSKKNIHVLHDQTNPKECCIEVTDNQAPQQQMISDDYQNTDINGGKKYFEFRYPEDDYTSNMIIQWRRLVNWMATSNPQPKYNKVIIKNERKFSRYDKVYVLNPGTERHEIIETFNPNIDEYYIESANIYGYTNEPLDSPQSFPPYEFRGYKADETLQADYTPLVAGVKTTQYATQEVGTDGQIIKDQPYTHDTYEYRMAKMLSQCEDYLCMDSIIYHYLFIEHHCMIDNVAKNTFWSTEDGSVWNLTKNYDNDTADGNDNRGEFSRTYGMEAFDKANSREYVFNAHQSVWFNFIEGLTEVCEVVRNKLEIAGVWNYQEYLKLFKTWQKTIPEICWIKDYRRKYIRPDELYNNESFLAKMEGGQKIYQREDFEIYQSYYMDSKYFGKLCSSYPLGNKVSVTSGAKGKKLPVKMYCDCYVRAAIGSGTYATIKERTKKNTWAWVEYPQDNLNDGTFYLYMAPMYSVIGDVNIENADLNFIGPLGWSFSTAEKLRELNVGNYYNSVDFDGDTLISFTGNKMLEKLYLCNWSGVQARPLDLSSCTGLKELDLRGSNFSEVVVADGAPITTLYAGNPITLKLSNLKQLNTLQLNFDRLTQLKINNIDINNSIHKISEFIFNEEYSIDEGTSILCGDKVGLNNEYNIILDGDIIELSYNLEDNDFIEQLTQKYFSYNNNYYFCDRIENNKIYCYSLQPNQIHSQYLVENSIGRQLQYYGLENVNWYIKDSSNLNSSQGTINVLEQLLRKGPNISNSQTLSLTGQLTITSNALNTNKSIDIYNKYAQENIYPNLKIIFTGDQSKLYPITILNGNNKVCWEKYTTKDGEVTTEFLSSGPNGQFNLSMIAQQDTPEYKYTFLNRWEVYDNENNFIEEIIGEMPLYTPQFIDDNGVEVIKGIVLKPVFEAIKQKYLVTFYNEDDILMSEEFEYGTLLKDIRPKEIPIKTLEDIPENFLQVYSFLGYGNSQTATSPLEDTERVLEERNLYAIFELKSVYENVLSEEYYIVNGQELILYDTSKVVLTGKITLPDIDGVTVFKGVNGQSKITHIFWENGTSEILKNNIFTFSENACWNLPLLQYVEAPSFNKIKIGDQAFNSNQNLFKNVPSQYIKKFFDNIVIIGNRAFTNNGSLGTEIKKYTNFRLELLNLTQPIGTRAFISCGLGGVNIDISLAGKPEENDVVFDTGSDAPNINYQ